MDQVIAGENEGSMIQDPSVEVVKREDSENKSNEEEGSVEIETVSKSKDSNSSSSSSSDSSDDESRVVEKEVVVVESVPAEEISTVVEPVNPVDSLSEEVSQVFDGIKHEETPVVEEEPRVDDCPDSTLLVESVLKEDEVERLESLVEKVPSSSEPKDCVSSSTPPKDLVSDVSGADRANEIETTEYSDRQAPAASVPVAVQNTTSWKSCCGIFELFSGSGQ